MNKCKICNNKFAESILQSESANEEQLYSCNKCGRYFITRPAFLILGGSYTANLSEEKRANASGWLRENPESKITQEKLNEIFSLDTPSIREKKNKLLYMLKKKTKFFGQEIEIKYDDLSWQAYAWAQNLDELISYLSYMSELGEVQLNRMMGSATIKVTPNGWENIERYMVDNGYSNQGFVAMPFDAEIDDLYLKAIKPAIDASGYVPHRVDDREHVDKIDDEIIIQIRRSKFVVADFTKNRGNVYFEAGFAKGLNKPVFWTSRKNEMLHFDIRQYNCLFWEPNELEDFQKRLAKRIEAVLGRGRKSIPSKM